MIQLTSLASRRWHTVSHASVPEPRPDRETQDLFSAVQSQYGDLVPGSNPPEYRLATSTDSLITSILSAVSFDFR